MTVAIQQQIYLAITRNQADLEWLQSALAALGQVLDGGKGGLDELLALVDVTNASVLFVGLERDNLIEQTALIEEVLSAKPLLAVVALGDGLDNQLVLGAMRAGARDFVAYGSRSSEVTGLVRHLSRRMPNVVPETSGALISMLFSSQQDADAALIAVHLGMVSQEAQRRTLVLDLGQLTGESLLILGIESAYHFGDAFRNLRRLDANLIDSAFTTVEGGMRLLTLADEDGPLDQCSPAELYLLIGTLRQHFDHIVVNLSGQTDSESLRVLIGHADHLLWCIDQSVPSCQRNLQLLRHWRDVGVRLEHARLLIDRYMRDVAPDDKTLCKTFEMESAAVLPGAAELRMNAKNLGRSMFVLGPRERLCQRLRSLGLSLSGVQESTLGGSGWWRGLNG